jgi:uncharacterized protein (DUF433 family)
MSTPIHTDEHGTIRIANTRVTLDVVIGAFRQERTPEQIQESFPTLTLAEIYAVIAYYLNNVSEVDEYLRKQREEAAQLRAEIEAVQPDNAQLRNRLLAHMDSRHHD